MVLLMEPELKKYFKNKSKAEDRSVNYYVCNLLQSIKDKEEAAIANDS